MAIVLNLITPLPHSSAYLLISHGSRDPRPQIAIEHLAKLVAQRLQPVQLAVEAERCIPASMANLGLGNIGDAGSGSSSEYRQPLSAPAFPLMGTAVLELGPTALHQQIQQFAELAGSQGYDCIQLVPLFLLPGVHVMEDIPTEVEAAQQQLGAAIVLNICPYLGSHPHLPELLINPIDPIANSSTTGKILISHGSRRPHGNQPVELVAARLNALPAYWSVPPDLETQITALVKQGCQQIAIVPYFLFEGGITDAIAQEVDRLASHFPYVHLHLTRPIGATPQLADCIIDLLA
ncbi:MAG: hypothetical protein Kow00121_32660 [Elainellaceae cyanobacterium]